jgi:tetratricopeptide (TPR) repeat protein
MRIAGFFIPVLLTAVGAGVAGAQDQCQLDEGRFGRQLVSIQQARAASTADQASRQVTAVVRDLTSRADYPAERAYLTAQALTSWINRAELSHQVTRGEVGLAGAASERVDLEQMIDSLYRSVEASHPGCAENIDQLRRSEAWVRLITAAYEHYQRNDHEAAEITARRSLRLHAGMPYGHNILAGIAQSRGQREEAIRHLRESVRTAEGDTAFTEVYHQALYGIGSLSSELAEQAEGAQRDELTRQGREAYERLLALPGVSDEISGAARQGLARTALAAGDTSAVQGLYADQLQNPDAYDYRALLFAGAAAAEVDRLDDAVRLFEAAQSKNQFHRDVLANLVFLYARTETPRRGIPLAERLLSVDPGNPESHRLASQAYAAVGRQLTARSRSLGDRANRTTNATTKRALIDSAAVVGDSIPKINEIIVRYRLNADSLPARLAVSNMGLGDGQVILRGTIQNATRTAATVSTRFELLDASGNVVGGQDVSVGPIQPGAAEAFTVTVAASNVAAFRYSPLSIAGQ